MLKMSATPYGKRADLPKRVLPADVYDTLELSALAFGGIGAGDFWDGVAIDDAKNRAPCCVFGHAAFSEDPPTGIYHTYFPPSTEVSIAMDESGLTVDTNDAAVQAINGRKAALWDARVSFDEWCRELGVTRGD